MKTWALILLWIFTLPTLAFAQNPPPPTKTIIVGTIERPPMMMRKTSGEIGGFAIDLWTEIAKRNDQQFEFKEFDLFGDMIEATKQGRVDLSIANITITSKREREMDYSQPIYDSGLQIILSADTQSKDGFSFLRVIWASGILWMFVGAFILLLIIAHIVWALEQNIEDRRHDYFRDDYLGGVWDAFWWAFIIMTMGGFENEVPHKKISRVIAMFWILVSLFFVSTLTAKITTALTVDQLSTGISSVKDLYGKRVGVINSASTFKFLDNLAISTTTFDQYDELYEALVTGEIDAIVGDEPIVRYYTLQKGRGRVILAGHLFKPEKYGALFPINSDLKENFDRTLIEIQEDGTYQKIYNKYFSTN